MTIRHCLIYGWNQPGQIANMAALNLKNHVQLRVENCLFRDNEIDLRLRGDSGQYGGADVAISDCAVYDGEIAVRAEDGISPLKIRRVGIAPSVQRSFVTAGARPGPEFEMTGKFRPPPFEDALQSGINQ